MKEFLIKSMSAYFNEIKKITLLSIFINLLLGFAKIFGGIYGCSHALVADGIHTFSDLFSDFAIYAGAKYWTKPPDKKHPYGHRRIENLVTAFLGLMLFGAAVTIVYRALDGLRGGRESYAPAFITIIITLCSIVFKELLYWKTRFVGKKINSSAVTANAWHHRTDSLSSIPVLVSLVIAIYIPGWEFVDLIGAVIVSVILFKVSANFIYDAFSVMTDKAAPDIIVETLEKIAKKNPEIKDIHKIRTRYTGNDVCVDLHLEFDPDMKISQAHSIAGALKQEMLDEIPEIVDIIIHIEPAE